MNNKVAEILTNRFIEEMEKGVIPWHKPWNGGINGAISHSTGKPYAFINQMFLDPGEYITFEQCKKEGGSVKKGAKSETVFQWIVTSNKLVDENGNAITDEEGNDITKTSFSLRYSKVFNVNDCENIKAKYFTGVKPSTLEPVEKAENVIANYINNSGVKFNACKSNEAFYAPASDSVTVPMLSQYTIVEEYYSTAFHELTHSTGHKTRLDRFSTGKAAAFGGSEYSKEELVAEIGAAALVNYCGLESTKSFRNSTAYLQGWLKALKNDSSLLMSASAKAQKAIDLILTNIDNFKPCKKDSKKDSKPANSNAGKLSAKATKAIMRIANTKNNRFPGFIPYENNYVVTNGYTAVIINNSNNLNLEILSETEKISEIIKTHFSLPIVEEIPVPAITDIKENLVIKNVTGFKVQTYDIGDRRVNAKMLLDILAIVPDVKTIKALEKHVLLFEGANTSAILLEIRK